MNTNWSKILLFSLISFALGVIICLLCCRMLCGGGGCGRHGSCGKGEMSMHGGHGDISCGHGMERMHGGKGSCCTDVGDRGDADVEVVIEKIKAADFQGDTVVAIEGGTVNIHREGDQMEVKVELTDTASTRKEKKVIVIEKEEKAS